MLRLLMLSTLLAAPAAAIAQPAAPRVAGWGVAEAPGSCMLHGASSQGTVISIWGFAGQDKLGFLIQNREWEQLREGQSVALELGFGGDRDWPVQATAKRNLDSDGPGFFFTFAPARSEGGSILDSIASGKGMKISRDGAAVDHVALDGSREAVAGLARCIAALWSAPGGGAAAGEELDKQDAEPQLDPTT